MTQTRTQVRPNRSSNAARYDGGRNRGFVAGSTEARPGIMTTEFWLSLLSAVTVVVAGYVSDAFNVDTGWALGAGIIAAYALSRGFAKSGSREGPFIIGLGDDEHR